MINFFRYWMGRNDLRHGYCPNCNSSPPDESCFVCHGWYRYGDQLTSTKKIMWLHRWDHYFGKV